MRKCSLCGRGSKIGGTRKLLRGHYNPVNSARKYPNLQWAVIPAKGGRLPAGRQVRKLVCARCIKTLHRKSQ